MNFPYHSNLTVESFIRDSGYDILRLPKNPGDNENTSAERYLLEIAEDVFNFVSNYRGYAFAKKMYESTDDEIISLLQRCEYYQARYIFENGGSLQTMDGSKDYTPLHELRGKRAYSPSMINELQNAGFLYCGVM